MRSIKSLFVVFAMLLATMVNAQVPDFTAKYDRYGVQTIRLTPATRLNPNSITESKEDSVRVGQEGTFLTMNIKDTALTIQGLLRATKIVEYSWQTYRNPAGAMTEIYFIRLANGWECTVDQSRAMIITTPVGADRRYRVYTIPIILKQKSVSN